MDSIAALVSVKWEFQVSYVRFCWDCLGLALLLLWATTNPRSVSAYQSDVDRSPLEGFVKSEIHMGVQFRISLYTTDEATAEQAFAASFAEIARLERVFSDYHPESETRRIDVAACDTPIELSADMRRLLETSLLLNRDTNGYFDVALGSLTKLWRTARREKKSPNESEVRAAAARIGSHRLELSQNQLRKQLSGVELDFGGIAKGDAADQVLSMLKNRFGITRVLIDASGDLVAGDPPPKQAGWVVGLSRPADDPGPLTHVYLANRALASSGDSTQFLETDQARWSHLLNPHTKMPIIGQNLTLVWATDGATADALASAFAICSADEFPKIAARFPEVAACVYRRTNVDQPTQVLRTDNWEQVIRNTRIN